MLRILAQMQPDVIFEIAVECKVEAGLLGILREDIFRFHPKTAGIQGRRCRRPRNFRSLVNYRRFGDFLKTILTVLEGNADLNRITCPCGHPHGLIASKRRSNFEARIHSGECLALSVILRQTVHGPNPTSITIEALRFRWRSWSEFGVRQPPPSHESIG